MSERTTTRVRLVHWKPEEAGAVVAALQAAGNRVEAAAVDAGELARLKAEPPDAVVIDLSRMPSQGRDLGLYLRKAAPTRHVPLVFVGGRPDKVAGVRELLPDGVFADPADVATAVAEAVAHPPRQPVVPASVMAGYSGTPLVKKLGIKAGSVLVLVGAPDDFENTLGELPEGVERRRSSRAGGDLTIWFVRSFAELEAGIATVAEEIGAGGVWITWPKKASGVASDLTQQRVRETGLAAGLVDFKVCAIDATWSGLRFVRRKQ